MWDGLVGPGGGGCDGPGPFGAPALAPSTLTLSPESGLFLPSTKAVDEDVGVTWPEPTGDTVLMTGEEVPEFESFFLEDLLESFARESCSC